MSGKEYTAAIVLAAGSGKRMGSNMKKQFMLLNGRPVIYYNYASAELLYKNMAVTAVFATGIGVVQQNTAEIIIGVVSAVLFVRRRICFAERSRGYTLCWFVQKYSR